MSDLLSLMRESVAARQPRRAQGIGLVHGCDAVATINRHFHDVWMTCWGLEFSTAEGAKSGVLDNPAVLHQVAK